MSATEMLNYAWDSPGINQQCLHDHNIFVHGHVPIIGEDEKYLWVDLEKDKIDFSENDIKISIDIDSIIWTIKTLVCKNSIGIYLTFIYDSKPGISKHNYVYVDILIS